jgi:hypothetical protein
MIAIDMNMLYTLMFVMHIPICQGMNVVDILILSFAHFGHLKISSILILVFKHHIILFYFVIHERVKFCEICTFQIKCCSCRGPPKCNIFTSYLKKLHC